MLTFIYVVHQRAAAQLASINVSLLCLTSALLAAIIYYSIFVVRSRFVAHWALNTDKYLLGVNFEYHFNHFNFQADKNVLYQEIKQLRNLSYEMIDSMVAEESEESLPNDSQLVQCDSSDSCKSLDLSRHAQYVKKLATLFENQRECRLMGRSLPSLPSLQSSIPS